MYKLTVYKANSSHKGEVSGSHTSVVIDHLKASAARHGFEAPRHMHDGMPSGDLIKDGNVVGYWEVSVA
ncbi:hypothetical protein SEA_NOTHINGSPECIAL_85 [Mycobacterium phage NothingSpecial]|nr:hypothetical protein SEA_NOTHINGSPECIAL_85 [Mycobacterium phage NothingSpecial]